MRFAAGHAGGTGSDKTIVAGFAGCGRGGVAVLATSCTGYHGDFPIFLGCSCLLRFGSCYWAAVAASV